MSKQIAKAVVIGFNWNTGETIHTVFSEDDDCDNPMRTAEGWAHKESFLWRDFPAKDGWTHFFHGNEKAKKIRGKKRAKEFLEGRVTLEVPK